MYGRNYNVAKSETGNSQNVTRGNLPELLKSTNAKAHGRLEQAVDFMNPRMTIAGYALLLQRFYGFITPWEDRLRTLLPQTLTPLFADRYKAPWIRQDLDGLRCLTSAVAPLSTESNQMSCNHLPDMSTTARLLGSAYVVEGSSLGGRIIAAHLTRHFAPQFAVPHRYFQCYGDKTGSMWKKYLAALTILVSEEDYAEVVDASAQTFAGLTDWFSSMKGQLSDCHE